MSNPGNADESKDDALAALHGLGGGQSDESEHDEAAHEEDLQLKAAEAHDEAAPGSAASGFVGMLAKEGAGETPPAPAAPAKPQREGIRMARELSPDELPQKYTPQTARVKKAKPAPGWYHGAIPVMFTLGAVLMLIGIWAVGALAYMAMNKPSAEKPPGYVWINITEPDDDGNVAYTSGSKMMATGMILCLPVAIAMGIMGVMMQKHVSKDRRLAGK